MVVWGKGCQGFFQDLVSCPISALGLAGPRNWAERFCTVHLQGAGKVSNTEAAPGPPVLCVGPATATLLWVKWCTSG